MHSRAVISKPDIERVTSALVGFEYPVKINWRGPDLIDVEEVKKRSINQNALLHMHFGEIAKQLGDRDASDVKGDSHMEWGLPIRLRDNGFAWLWERATANLDYAKKREVCKRGYFSISSGMTTAELREYIDAQMTYYQGEGLRLTQPEDRT